MRWQLLGQLLFLVLTEESTCARLASAQAVRAEGSRTGRRDLARALGDQMIKEFAGDDDWHVLLLEFWMPAVRDPSIRRQFVQHRRRLRELIAGQVEEVYPGGDSALSAGQIATTILAMSNGLAIERILDKESGEPATFGILLERLLEHKS